MAFLLRNPSLQAQSNLSFCDCKERDSGNLGRVSDQPTCSQKSCDYNADVTMTGVNIKGFECTLFSTLPEAPTLCRVIDDCWTAEGVDNPDYPFTEETIAEFERNIWAYAVEVQKVCVLVVGHACACIKETPSLDG